MEQNINRWISLGYAHEVANIIIENPEDESLDRETLIEQIVKRAQQNLEEREELDPSLTEDQIVEAVDLAAKAAIDKTIHSLVDKDLIKTGVDENGDIVYSLTDVGRIVADELKNKDNTDKL